MIALLSDIEVGYDESGTGVPVMFIHGYPHDRRLWAHQMHGLGARARCVSLDLRGFGETTAVPPWTMDRYADDVVALMDMLRLERAVIAGLSMGGYIAFAIWRRHPERVRALVLANTRAGADSAEGREKRKASIALARERGSAAIADSVMTGMLGKSTRESRPDIVESVRSMLVAQPVEGIVGALQAMMDRPDSTPTLATIDAPVLIVSGDEDAIIPVEEARAMHAAIRGSQLEIIAKAGHLSNLERPAAFNHVLSEFLGRLVLE
jgi:3-oxoadipate enol-lactonase